MTRCRVLVVMSLMVATMGGCDQDPRPLIISHRAHGVAGVFEENKASNVPLLIADGFGVEIDIRADGERPFELGHNGPQGENLDDVLTSIEERWTDDMAGRLLVLDVSDDEDDGITRGLIPYLEERIPGSVLAELVFIVQVSQEPSLLAMKVQADERDLPFDVRFAFTQWIAPEYTVPEWVDYLVGNINEMPTYPFPKPLILFGVQSRSSYEQVVNHPAEVFGVLTDHPRRIQTFQPEGATGWP
jgi:hypothetical protein